MTMWQPIATAPKGRAAILLANKPQGLVQQGRFYEHGAPAGFYSDNTGPEAIEADRRPATHWMPLPEPPSE